jgi:ubiquinone/menaquinone biosynthesis C-methylase UbiE
VTSFDDEAQRIRAEYVRRSREIPADYYSLGNPAILFQQQQRARVALRRLSARGFMPLEERQILDVGCGRGDWLSEFESWGAKRSHLAGIDLDDSRGAFAADRLCDRRDNSGNLMRPGADIRIGDASTLPWPAASFDIVLLSTVFSSILNLEMRQAIACEIERVLRPDGVVLWYDFFVNNPANPSVRGVRAAEIRALFPDFRVRLQRVTLAPPIARRLVTVSWLCALALERTTVFNTHYFGVLDRLQRNT